MHNKSPCIEWEGTVNNSGYGVVQEWINGRQKTTAAHRWIYQRYRGPIDPGMQLDHLCRNRLCVNTDHLEQVTHEENIRRANASRADGRRLFERQHTADKGMN